MTREDRVRPIAEPRVDGAEGRLTLFLPGRLVQEQESPAAVPIIRNHLLDIGRLLGTDRAGIAFGETRLLGLRGCLRPFGLVAAGRAEKCDSQRDTSKRANHYMMSLTTSPSFMMKCSLLSSRIRSIFSVGSPSHSRISA